MQRDNGICGRFWPELVLSPDLNEYQRRCSFSRRLQEAAHIDLLQLGVIDQKVCKVNEVFRQVAIRDVCDRVFDQPLPEGKAAINLYIPEGPRGGEERVNTCRIRVSAYP